MTDDLRRENADSYPDTDVLFAEVAAHHWPTVDGFCGGPGCGMPYPCLPIRLTVALEQVVAVLNEDWEKNTGAIDRLERENAELHATIDRAAEYIAANITNNATWQTAIQLERVGFDGAAIAEATTWDALAPGTRDLLRGVIREALAAPASPRLVETAAELDALPFMTVIREIRGAAPSGNDYGLVWEKWRSPTGGVWMPIGGRFHRGERGPELPVEVLWLPDTEAGA